MSDYTKTIDEVVDESFQSAGTRNDFIDRALTAWRERNEPCDLTPSEVQSLIEKAVDKRALVLIKQEAEQCLKDREPTAEEMAAMLEYMRAKRQVASK